MVLIEDKGFHRRPIVSLIFEWQFTDYGATLVGISLPDRRGVFEDVLLGFDDVAEYESDANQYFGAAQRQLADGFRE